VQLPTLRC